VALVDDLGTQVWSCYEHLPEGSMPTFRGRNGNWSPVEETGHTLPRSDTVWSDNTTFCRVLGVGIHTSDLGQRLSAHTQSLYSKDEEHPLGTEAYVWIPEFLYGYEMSDNVWQGRIESCDKSWPEYSIGSTWWSKDTYEPFQLQDVCVTSEGYPWVVLASEVRSAVSNVPSGYFSSHFSQDQPEPPCEVGQEWESRKGGSFVEVQETANGGVSIVSDTGSEYLCYAKFLRLYRRSERRSFLSRLLGENLFDLT
jgi:hypothetical protein